MLTLNNMDTEIQLAELSNNSLFRKRKIPFAKNEGLSTLFFF
jgi:hypothetical protein